MHIYPKQISKLSFAPKKNFCFVLMPFNIDFDEIYSEIKASLTSLEYTVNRADDLYANKPIMNIVVSEIISSHFIIADLTNKNPNVFYEVGIAHSLRDATNVILISQSMDFVPFDLRHLPVIVYDKNNLRGLTTKIRKKILENKSNFECFTILKERYYYQINNKIDFEELLEFIEQEQNFIKLISQSLGDDSSLSSDELKETIFRLKQEIIFLSTKSKITLLNNLLKIFLDILYYNLDIKEISHYVLNILKTCTIDNMFNTSLDKELEFTIDLAIKIFYYPNMKKISIKWLLDYLSKDKVGGIDLNRTKVESFLLSTKDQELINIIRDTFVTTQNELVRESLADIIGEFRSNELLPYLKLIFEREKNPYIVRSIISAFGKINVNDTKKITLKWIEHNYQDIKDKGWFFIIEYAKENFKKLPYEEQLIYLEKINQFS